MSTRSSLASPRCGTHVGAPLMGMPPSGRRAEWTEIGVLEIENGKIVKSWYEVDMLIDDPAA